MVDMAQVLLIAFYAFVIYTAIVVYLNVLVQHLGYGFEVQKTVDQMNAIVDARNQALEAKLRERQASKDEEASAAVEGMKKLLKKA